MRKTNNNGLTLMELIVVVAIMAVLVGTTVIGIGILSSGDAEKASKNIRSVLNEVRTDTLSIQADWSAKIHNDDGTYTIAVYRDGEEYDTIDLGYRIDIFYGDGREAIEDGDELTISYRQSSGAVKKITISKKGAEAQDIAEDTSEFKITVSNSGSDFVLTLWKETGKITSGD